MTPLDELITENALANLAGSAAYARGKDYFETGAVAELRCQGESVAARVRGSEVYGVTLRSRNDELDYRCDCPRAADGYFCKHCVAVGLAFIASSSPSAPGPHEYADLEANVRRFLADRSKTELIDLICSQTSRDPDFQERLETTAGFAADAKTGLQALRKAITRATRTGEFVDWRGAPDFAHRVGRVIESLEHEIHESTAAALLPLIEYAVQRVELASEHVDDSNGDVGNLLGWLSELHHRTCVLAKPDPIALAERLFHAQMNGASDVYHDAELRYADQLGPAGLRRIADLAEPLWERIEPLGPGDSAFKDIDSPVNRFRITHIVENLAKLAGDLDAQVAVLTKDLRLAYNYLNIAEVYRNAQRPEQALEWAERGRAAFPVRTDNRLRDFLVEAYLGLGRNDEALELVWVQFEEFPSLDHYAKLHGIATRLQCWTSQRIRALTYLDEPIQAHAQRMAAIRGVAPPSDRSLRVKIALWENELDVALELLKDGFFDTTLAIQLAERLAKERPADALELYRSVVPRIVEQTDNRAYREAVRYLRTLSKLSGTVQRSDEFTVFLAHLRTRFKAKRNFIKLLNETFD